MRKRFLFSALIIIVVLTSIIAFVVYHNYNQNYYNLNNYGAGPVKIEVTTDKSSYFQGEKVNLTIYVTNEHDWSILMPDRVIHRMINSDGIVFDSDINIDFTERVSFPAHSRIFYDSFIWDQDVEAGDNITYAKVGNYTFSVVFFDSSSYGKGGNCTFEIKQNS